VEKQSYADIARRYGVTKTTVKRWLRVAGISARSISEGTSLAQKGRTISEKHRAALAESLVKARAARTEESFKKISASNKGRKAPNKGKAWTPEEREKHMAYRQTPEYREKLAAAKRGDKAPAWRGGVTTTDPRLRTWQWRELRRQVYERDEWTCRDCGVHCHNKIQSRNERGRRIQAHHIVSRRDGGKDEIDNLMTLCMSCHMKREWREHRREETR
jgi:5-methylcytosine-specific restriction endonuclease McrA